MGVIDDLLDTRTVELMEYAGPINIPQVAGVFCIPDVRFAISSLLNKPQNSIYAILTA